MSMEEMAKPEMVSDDPNLISATSLVSNSDKTTKMPELFSSEHFKLRLDGVPKYMGIGQLKKYFTRYHVNPVKIKKSPQWEFAYITFRTLRERDQALEKLQGQIISKCPLKITVSEAKKDPLKEIEDKNSNQIELEIHEKSPEELRKSLYDRVTPLWNLSYEDQLLLKMKTLKTILNKCANRLRVFQRSKDSEMTSSLLESWSSGFKSSSDHQCQLCPLDEIHRSPVLTGYRNKYEFAIGRDSWGRPEVGFALGAYRDGTISVQDPEGCLNVSEDAIKICHLVRDRIINTNSHYEVFDRKTHKGIWRMLVMRTYSTREVMLIFQIHPQELTEQDLSQLKVYIMESLKDHRLHITTLLLQLYTGRAFRISPSSFFQINTKATEVLYSIIKNQALRKEMTDEIPSILLDLCSGTGTIGMSLSPFFKEVIGIESTEQAVLDANQNAQINQLTNVRFICAKVEQVIDKLLRENMGQSIVAILDPPRQGVPSSVIRVIRNCTSLKRLVYVSCNPEAASQNFIDLCRPTSQTIRGPPFTPIQAIPVDLFPHTEHCELVLLFERHTSPRVDDDEGVLPSRDY